MKKQKNIHLIFLIYILISCQNFAQELTKSSFEISEGKVFVHYELSGDTDDEYTVSIKLKRTSIPSFEAIPLKLAGDVGTGKFAGKKNTITWYLTDEEKKNFNGNDYYFEIKAQRVPGSSMSWLYYIGGALIGGSAAAVLILNKNNNQSGQQGNTTVPAPPSRPAGD